MPRIADLNTTIRNIIATELKAALAPIEKKLARVSKGARRGPGRPPKAVAAAKPVRRRARWGAKAKAALRAAAKFDVGQTVKFNVGRRVCEGKVLKIDAKTSALTLERSTDGKKIVRPAEKVKAA